MVSNAGGLGTRFKKMVYRMLDANNDGVIRKEEFTDLFNKFWMDHRAAVLPRCRAWEIASPSSSTVCIAYHPLLES